MEFIVDEMLEDIARRGYKSEEVKECVVELLNPYFSNKDKLQNNTTDSEFLSIFSYLLRYYYDKDFKEALSKILSIYNEVYEKHSKELKSIIFSTVEMMSQKENLMWTVKKNTPQLAKEEDIFETTYTLMKHIGDVLEISAKHEIVELYAVIKLVLNDKIEYETIRKQDFGVINKNILDKHFFENILKTVPNNIKLSDWRNIAYHHTYEIIDHKIRCFYGKKGNYFDITVKKLEKYATDIIKACNVIDISRRIFIYDHSEIFAEFEMDSVKTHDRKIMKLGQLKTSFLSQGFKILNAKLDDDLEEMVLQDIKLSDLSSYEFKIERVIHCTQFLYNIWYYLPAENIKIIHMDNLGKLINCYSVNGDICKRVATGDLNFEDMIQYIKIEKSNHHL